MLPSFLQRHVGIDAQGDPFLLVHKAVFQPPPLAAARGDFQIQATSVKHFSGFIAGFSMTDSGVGEGHLLVLTADLSPILPLVVKGYYWASLDKKRSCLDDNKGNYPLDLPKPLGLTSVRPCGSWGCAVRDRGSGREDGHCTAIQFRVMGCLELAGIRTTISRLLTAESTDAPPLSPSRMTTIHG